MGEVDNDTNINLWEIKYKKLLPTKAKLFFQPILWIWFSWGDADISLKLKQTIYKNGKERLLARW